MRHQMESIIKENQLTAKEKNEVRKNLQSLTLTSNTTYNVMVKAEDS